MSEEMVSVPRSKIEALRRELLDRGSQTGFDLEGAVMRIIGLDRVARDVLACVDTPPKDEIMESLKSAASAIFGAMNARESELEGKQ